MADNPTVITLYRMLHATDTFDEMHSLLLSRRLIDTDSCQLDKETRFLVDNKGEFGEQFN